MLLPSTRVVVVTSPAQSHPSTEIIWATLNSLTLLGGLAEAPITVVCDGCRPASSLEPAYAQRLAARLATNPIRFSKRGIVTDDVAAGYEQFKRRLIAEAAEAGYGEDRLALLELNSHHGFGFSVREGLRSVLAAGAQYALIVQHDRAFCRRMPASDVRRLFAHFERHAECRYIGFPSGTSKLLARRTQLEYKLSHLLEQRTYALRSGGGSRLALRPCIFWYDSNHLVDAAKALELFAPFECAPRGLLERLGGAGLNRFRLRRGDFTEERFGVEQRNLLVGLRDEPEACVRYFDWFGSYLLEELVEEGGDGDGEAEDGSGPLFCDRDGRVTYVDHIDARGAVPPSRRRAGALRRARKAQGE